MNARTVLSATSKTRLRFGFKNSGRENVVSENEVEISRNNAQHNHVTLFLAYGCEARHNHDLETTR